MRPLSAAELLAAWEGGLGRPPAEGTLLLLAAASPPATPQEMALLPVGRRDRRLLDLFAWTFGPRLVAQASCPECGEQLELSFTIDQITGEDRDGSAGPLRLTSGNWEVELRLPDSRDLAEIAAHQEPLAESRRRLAARSVSSARRGGRKMPPGKLPRRLVGEIAELLAAADPQADVELALFCPSCARPFTVPFDIVTFFWHRLDAWAKRLLREVDALARAYGWSEGEILSLTPLRRQCYLDMVGA